MEHEQVVEDPGVWREVEVEASPEHVWEQLATEEGRERWLEPDPGRQLEVTESDPPERIVWWWWHEHEAPRRVELIVIAIPSGSRVIAIETEPALPFSMLAAACRASLARA